MSVPYLCPDCFAPMGRLVEEPTGRISLDTGQWLIGEGKRYCHACGKQVHFKRPNKSMDELLSRHVKRHGIADLMNAPTRKTGFGQE